MLLLLSLLLLVTICTSIECPKDTGTVFFVDKLTDKHRHCFESCALSNCTGVLSTYSSCVAIETSSFYGQIDENRFFRKHCVEGMKDFTVVSLSTAKVLLDNTEKIIKTKDEYHCLALCQNEKKFDCLSAMFYNENSDCLLNSRNSDTAPLTDDTQGFEVVFMERRLPKTTRCSSSFQVIPWDEKTWTGTLTPFNTSSLANCMKLCKSCDLIIFNEIDTVCFLVHLGVGGEKIDFLNEEYQVAKNLCSDVTSCNSQNSLFVTYKGFKREEKRRCLQKCIASSDCNSVYFLDNNTCSFDDQDGHLMIERQCSGMSKMETGVLYEEMDECPTSTTGMKVTGIELHECMTLCLTHPTKSCDAISYFHRKKTCLLFDGSPNINKLPTESKECRHFTLNVISTPEDDIIKETKGVSKIKPKAAGSKTSVQKISSSKFEKYRPKRIDVKTICSMSTMTVEITSSRLLIGHLFARNAFDNCSVPLKGEKYGRLVFDLKDDRKCPFQKTGDVYKAVIVVKENGLNNLPVITENDQLYSVSCDYSNHRVMNVTTNKTMTLRDSSFHEMEVAGTVDFSRTMKMELRGKRQQSDEPRKNKVKLGQEIELVFETDEQMVSDFIVDSCVATSSDDKDNLTLIENGCPTASTRKYIVRGGIKRHENGFSLPLRAFKFQSRDGVKIRCQLNMCSDECQQVSCDLPTHRIRRNLPVPTETKDVYTEMFVSDTQVQEGISCEAAYLKLIGISVFFLTFLIFLVIFVKCRIVNKHI